MQRRTLLMLAGLWPLGAAAGTPLPLVYPRHQALDDPQQAYVTALLQQALERSGQAYALRRSALRMVQTRAMQEIATASGSVDVVWAMTSRARETQLLPVRIPIDRGLIGWRVALIQARQPDLLRGVRSIAALARLSAGQMRDWPDAAILLALDAHLVIRYPAALYFFVGKHRPELAGHIETGLEAMLADGSFTQLFRRHFGRIEAGLKLSQRHVLDLANPDLPEETPLARKALWYRPKLY
ncbi:MAG: hypothetical protein RSF79_21385 [Janthinobacterium sp.]